MAPIEKIAMRIKRLRADRQLSQAELAERAGISHGYLARLETGRQDPTIATLEKLARALKVRVAELLEDPRPAMARAELVDQLIEARTALRKGKNVLAIGMLAEEMERLGPDYRFHARILRVKGDNRRVIDEITSILGKLASPD